MYFNVQNYVICFSSKMCLMFVVTAVRMDLFDVALTLISKGAPVNQYCLKKWTALHEAAKMGCTDILRLLLIHGGKISETDQHGVTPIAVAAEYGQTEALEILIQNGQHMAV